MSAGHTPGPWSFKRASTANANIFDIGGDGNLLAFTCATCDESAANARLIAAAPDGLALAELAMQLIDDAALVERDHPQASLRPLRLAAEAFLAKTTGAA